MKTYCFFSTYTIQIYHPLFQLNRNFLRKIRIYWNLPFICDLSNNQISIQRNKIRLFLWPVGNYLINSKIESKIYNLILMRIQEESFSTFLLKQIFFFFVFQINFNFLPHLILKRLIIHNLNYANIYYTKREISILSKFILNK